MRNEEALHLFDSIYSAHHQAVYAYLLGRLSLRQEAEDLLQDVFVRVWRHLDSARALPKTRQRYWLMAIARNLTIDYYRRRGARGGPSGDRPLDEVGLLVADGGEVSHAQRLDLEAAIAALPEEQRVVLSMRYVAGLNSSEIGDALDKPAGTVRYLLSRARTRLGELMEPEARAHEEAVER